MRRGLALLLLAACSNTAKGPCESAADCGGRLDCIDGECQCRTDDACGEGMYCNPFGACQPRPPCLGNKDCAAGYICNSSDASGGKCILDNQCGSSVHCPFNSYCNTNGTTATCVPGCRSTGDCQLGWVCSGGACLDANTTSNCTQCPGSPEPDASYCDYGEVCTSAGQCQAYVDQASLCLTCDTSNSVRCSGASTICLIDPDVAGAEYCAPSCRTNLDCPSGYGPCGPLQLVAGLCEQGNTGPCECTNTGSCPNGSSCRASPESNRAFCECVNQAECDIYGPVECYGFPFNSCNVGVPCNGNPDCAPYGTSCQQGLCGINCSSRDECICAAGRCTLTDLPCTTAADCNVSCVNGSCLTDVGGCGKASGTSCNDLRTGVAPCRTH